ncbi:Y-family DNA polymerase [Melittangium boletus]|uniref:Y-family DNA polymerase n=1 Tax=Melittangium boletus TaxID=83453 RepID=UPI003DA3B761
MRLGYLHFPRFPVQRKVIELPELTGKPFVLVEEVRGQQRVAGASTSALKAGVRPGTTLTAACALEPALRHFTYRPDEERRALVALGEMLMDLAPGFQLAEPDGLWLDAGAAHLVKGEEGLCARVLERCEELGWRGRLVVASELFTARALARHGTRSSHEVVPDGESARALGPLPLGALEGPEQAAFAALGLSTLGEVAALPVGAVTARGGAVGMRAHGRCRGADETPFLAEVLEEVLEERLTLEWPAESLEPLQFALKTVLDRLCGRLSGRRRAAVRLGLTLKLEPSGQVLVPLTLARPTAQGRMLLDLTRHRLSDVRLEGPVAGLVLRVEEDCEDRGQQLALGDAPQGDADLEVVLSRLATALGEDSLFMAALEDSHRPEAGYTPRAFRPPPARRGLEGEGLVPREAVSPVPEVLRERPARLLGQPLPLEVHLTEAGEWVAARLGGQWRRVVALMGPERLSGDWWEARPYSRDYYRVHLEGVGQAWVFRDGRDSRFYLQGLFD